jgi:hypothetical protein
MKILFILGGVEPGKNGVGDYTRSLVGSLETLGVKGNIIATHDTDVTEIIEEEQWSEGVSVPVLRIPRDTTKEARSASIVSALRQIDPDWVSIQFVSYSFHRKGLPLVFLCQLEVLLNPYRVHLMFHECWIGISRSSSLRHSLVGWLQKWIIVGFAQRLSPLLISTSNELYRKLLEENNIHAELLPLFSNISKVSPVSGFWNRPENKFKDGSAVGDDGKYLLAGIFGTIYPQKDLVTVLRKLSWRACNEGKSLLIITFGRAGIGGLDRLTEAVVLLEDNSIMLHLGELSSEEVSTVLQKIDVAISCTPRHHLGKSGVFAAMQLHGVEVIESIGTLLPEYQDIIESSVTALYARPAVEWSSNWVAQRLVNRLVLLFRPISVETREHS